MTAIDPKYFAILRRFDTPTVCNVIELFDVRPRNEGFMDASIRALYPRLPPAVGYATTATFRSAQPAREGDVYSSLGAQVERFLKEIHAPRFVVFQDLDGTPRGATFGEVMASIFKAFGCVGLITSGAGRDLEQIDRLAFPCFASAVVASHAYCRVVEVNVPVTVGGLAIRPGDIIHADANGVTTIPAEIAAEVALGCEKLARAENEVLHYVTAGAPDAAGLKAAQARCRDAFARLADEVRRDLGAER